MGVHAKHRIASTAIELAAQVIAGTGIELDGATTGWQLLLEFAEGERLMTALADVAVGDPTDRVIVLTRRAASGIPFVLVARIGPPDHTLDTELDAELTAELDACYLDLGGGD